MTLAEMRTRTLALLDDPEGERYADYRVDQALNDAALDLCIRSGCLKDSASLAVERGVDTIDIAASVSGLSVGYVDRLAWNDALRPGLRPASMDEIDLAGYAPEGMEPAYWHLFRAPGVVVVQKPMQSGTLFCEYVAEPPALKNAGDALPLPESICSGVCHGAAELILEDGEDLGRAAFHGKAFEDSVRDAVWPGQFSAYDDMRPL